ncbi:MAG: hypothetical protein K0S07_681 [Chlamydiales bacterium]|jgi:hypothetical protein|nr:hypothetical protein [Chlamydiales bacterium]
MERIIEKTLEESSPLQASKWIQIPFLLGVAEWDAFLELLSEALFYQSKGVLERGQGKIAVGNLKEGYRCYIQALQRGELPDMNAFNASFHAFISLELDALYALKIDAKRCLIKASRPVIHLQPHRMEFSSDGSLRSQVYGLEPVEWGLKIAYPTLYQRSDGQVCQVFPEKGVNTRLFEKMQRWLRFHSSYASFIINGQKKTHSIRLGKEVLPWINNHPQLSKKGVTVIGGGPL